MFYLNRKEFVYIYITEQQVVSYSDQDIFSFNLQSWHYSVDYLCLMQQKDYSHGELVSKCRVLGFVWLSRCPEFFTVNDCLPCYLELFDLQLSDQIHKYGYDKE